MGSQLDLTDLDRLYSSLTAAERDELLQAILVAASKGGKEVIDMLEAYCLTCASRELIADFTECGAESRPLPRSPKNMSDNS